MPAQLRGASWKRADNGMRGSIRLTSLTLSCAAEAHVPKFARRGGCEAAPRLAAREK
jgi:hypothetical protein